MFARSCATLTFATTWLALTASSALAQAVEHDNGEGLLGETTDRLVTFFSLGVVIFFASFVVIMSLIQHRLEQRHHDDHGARRRVGW